MTKRFNSMEEVTQANKLGGYNWFEIPIVKLFFTQIESELFDGRYFITSERCTHFAKKRYTIREVLEDGDIGVIGTFQGYVNKSTAKKAILKLIERQ